MIFFMEIATVKAEATTRTGLQDTDTDTDTQTHTDTHSHTQADTDRHRQTQIDTDRQTRTCAHACTHTPHTNTHILMAVHYVKHIQGK